MKKLMIVLLFVCLTACSSETTTTTPPAEPAAEPATPPPAAEPAPEPTPAPPPPAPEPPKAVEPAKAAVKPADKPADKPASPKKVYANFETSMGNFKAELNEKEAPITVASFIGLASGTKEWTDPRTGQVAKKPYYDGLTFHRIIDGFMIQGGDPLGTGAGGPGFTIKDEYNNLTHDKAGVLAMARTGAPDSAGSQFYITVVPTTQLDGRKPPYVVFGQVVEGVENVIKIGKVATGPNDKPITPVIINKITIERAK